MADEARELAMRAFAREQYEKRPQVDLPNKENQPRSGRFMIWYGWKDTVQEPYFPGFIARAYTFQCENINPKNQHRCRREVCIASQYCSQHLFLLGIEVHMIYKCGSEVVDHVEKITVTREFPKDSIVLRLHGEFLDQAAHLERYQKKNKCGPHEFGIRDRKENKYIYIDLVRSSNEAGYLPIRENGNLYIDLDTINFDNPNNKAFNLKA
jgi:hypothetical protein